MLGSSEEAIPWIRGERERCILFAQSKLKEFRESVIQSSRNWLESFYVDSLTKINRHNVKKENEEPVISDIHPLRTSIMAELQPLSSTVSADNERQTHDKTLPHTPWINSSTEEASSTQLPPSTISEIDTRISISSKRSSPQGSVRKTIDNQSHRLTASAQSLRKSSRLSSVVEDPTPVVVDASSSPPKTQRPTRATRKAVQLSSTIPAPTVVPMEEKAAVPAPVERTSRSRKQPSEPALDLPPMKKPRQQRGNAKNKKQTLEAPTQPSVDMILDPLLTTTTTAIPQVTKHVPSSNKKDEEENEIALLPESTHRTPSLAQPESTRQSMPRLDTFSSTIKHEHTKDNNNNNNTNNSSPSTSISASIVLPQQPQQQQHVDLVMPVHLPDEGQDDAEDEDVLLFSPLPHRRATRRMTALKKKLLLASTTQQPERAPLRAPPLHMDSPVSIQQTLDVPKDTTERTPLPAPVVILDATPLKTNMNSSGTPVAAMSALAIDDLHPVMTSTPRTPESPTLETPRLQTQMRVSSTAKTPRMRLDTQFSPKEASRDTMERTVQESTSCARVEDTKDTVLPAMSDSKDGQPCRIENVVSHLSSDRLASEQREGVSSSSVAMATIATHQRVAVPMTTERLRQQLESLKSRHYVEKREETEMTVSLATVVPPEASVAMATHSAVPQSVLPKTVPLPNLQHLTASSHAFRHPVTTTTSTLVHSPKPMKTLSSAPLQVNVPSLHSSNIIIDDHVPIGGGEDDDDDDEEEEEDGQNDGYMDQESKKEPVAKSRVPPKVPPWAREETLHAQLSLQQKMQVEEIFGYQKNDVDLKDIFGLRKYDRLFCKTPLAWKERIVLAPTPSPSVRKQQQQQQLQLQRAMLLSGEMPPPAARPPSRLK